MEDGSGCPNTCQSPKSEDTCTDVDIAGCQCKKGYVREGDKCVPYSECGCMMQGRYYPVSNPRSTDCQENQAVLLSFSTKTLVF